MVDRVMIPRNYESELKWGKLVMTWSTGVSHFGAGTNVLPVPRTISELKKQCADIGLEIDIPASITGLSVMQYSAETLALRLPPKSMVEAVLAEIKAGGEYPIPSYYETVFGQRMSPSTNKVELQALRIGDYSISNCG